MNKLTYIVVATLLLSSCEDFFSTTIDLELPPHESLLVVNASVDVGEDQLTVYVSQSIDPLSSETFEYVKDAVVLLKQNDTVLDTLEYLEAPLDFYQTAVQLQEGHTYQLEVSHSAYPKATSEVSVPTAIVISSVALGDTVDYSRALQFSIQDPSEDNFYLLRISVSEGDNSGGVWFESVDPSFEKKGLIEEGFDGRKILFNDQLFNDTYKTFSLDFDYWEGIDSVKVQLYTVSPSYYHYHESRKLQNHSERGPSAIMGAEPVVVYNNIQNGFGVFAARSNNEFVVGVE